MRDAVATQARWSCRLCARPVAWACACDARCCERLADSATARMKGTIRPWMTSSNKHWPNGQTYRIATDGWGWMREGAGSCATTPRRPLEIFRKAVVRGCGTKNSLISSAAITKATMRGDGSFRTDRSGCTSSWSALRRSGRYCRTTGCSPIPACRPVRRNVFWTKRDVCISLRPKDLVWCTRRIWCWLRKR